MSEKWWDMSDDELDDLIRDASDKVDVPFDSSSFDKLRHKMDSQRQPETPKGFKKRWLLLLAGLILLVGVGLVYRFGSQLRKNITTEIAGIIEKKKSTESSDVLPSVLSETHTKERINKKSELINSDNLSKKSALLNEQKERIIDKSTSPVLAETLEKTEKDNFSKLSLNKPKTDKNITKKLFEENIIRKQNKTTSNDNSTVENANTFNQREKVVEYKLDPASVNNSETDSQIINNSQQKTSENIYYNSTDNQLVIKNNTKNRKDKKGKSYAQNSIVIERNASPLPVVVPIVERWSSVETQTTVGETINKTNFYDVDFLKNKDSKSLLTDIRTELPSYIDSLPRTVKPIKFSKFGIRLALSPDFNSLENLGTSALGGTVGLLFEYKLNKKLILQTGITYSNKKYIGSFDDYHNWTDWKAYHPSKPTEVDGGCKVIDVPINLRLNLFQKPKQTWFVSSGVSSYWMLNENYTYLYAWSPAKSVDWNYNSKYYFSVLNFSIGLDRQISKNFSLQIEPYLKTPLKSVGTGGVNLYSSGVLFSTKYEF